MTGVGWEFSQTTSRVLILANEETEVLFTEMKNIDRVGLVIFAWEGNRSK